MLDAVMETAESLDSVTTVLGREQAGGSEDASFIIERVQESGGVGTYVGVGASNVAGHHTPRFDIDEDSLEIGVEVVTATIRDL
jgi:aminobenzoyl-glutamate utilization protein A